MGWSKDSGFKFQTDQGFWIQISKRAGFWIQISKWVGFWIQISTLWSLISKNALRIQERFFNFLGFKFQSNFLELIFQKGVDSGFKFQKGGRILDSDLG